MRALAVATATSLSFALVVPASAEEAGLSKTYLLVPN
jgi:hypothetical protein